MESKLKDLFEEHIEVVLPELVKASIAAHTINLTLHKVIHEQMPRLNETESGACFTRVLWNYLEQQCDRVSIFHG